MAKELDKRIKQLNEKDDKESLLYMQEGITQLTKWENNFD